MCLLCGDPAGPCVSEAMGFNPSSVPFEGVKLGGDFGDGSGIVTWSIAGAGVDIGEFRNNDLSRDFSETFRFDVEEAIRAAFAEWSAAADVDFVQVADDGAAGREPSIGFARIFHGRPQEPFNYGGVYFPSEDPTGGNIMIADDPIAQGRDGQGQPINFIDLLLHQIGHLIGLNHTDDPRSVMIPSVFSGGPGLGVADRSAAQAVYGPQDGAPLIYALAETQEAIDALHATDRLILEGNPLDNRLSATEAADTLRGGAGDDTMEGRGGDDRLVGGEGFDMALIGGAAKAVLRRLTDDGVTIEGPDGTDSLSGVEEARFDDGAWRFDLAGPDLPFLYRVYDAAFARTPDGPGLAFWNGELLAGRVGREDLAMAFMESAEFDRRYGADPTDEAYVQALYQNALRRPADDTGLDFWTEAFATGTLGRDDMLVEFADSPENIARNAENLEDGVFVL